MTRKKSLILFLVLLMALLWPGSPRAVYAYQTPPFEVAVSLAANPSPSFVGQPVTLSIRASTIQAGAGVPSGSVKITSGQNLVCDMLLDSTGEASCIVSYASPVRLTFKAVYQGTGRFLPAVSSDVSHTVIPRFASTVTISSHTPSPSIRNQVVTVSASVSSSGPVPSGTLTIFRGDAACTLPAPSFPDRCTASMSSGAGTCSLPLSQAGEVNLCAAYSGDAGNLPSVGRVAHWVSGTNTALGIQRVDPSPSLINQPAWVYFTVTSPAGVPPSDTIVTVTSGVETCSASLAVGRCAITFHQPHLNPVTASYPGAAGPNVVFEPSTSNVWVQRVNAPPTDIQLSNTTINSFMPSGAEVGTFSTTDPNPDESHVYTLVNGVGAVHNSLFTIQNNRLALLNPLNQDSGSLSIRVRSTDPAGLSIEKVFLLEIESGVLPETGFAPMVTTSLPAQPSEKAYFAVGEMTLEIPRLGVSTQVVGVPWGSGWDATWLGSSAGWLAGTAFPTWQGNSVLVGHNFLADGSAGPFAGLSKLKWGDKIIVRAFGQTAVYEVRSVERVQPGNDSPLRHEDKSWLTLITCQGYDEELQTYRSRTVVRAVLIQIGG